MHSTSQENGHCHWQMLTATQGHRNPKSQVGLRIILLIFVFFFLIYIVFIYLDELSKEEADWKEVVPLVKKCLSDKYFDPLCWSNFSLWDLILFLPFYWAGNMKADWGLHLLKYPSIIHLRLLIPSAIRTSGRWISALINTSLRLLSNK